MSSPITVTVTRTVRLRIAPSVEADTVRAIENTQAEWGKAVRFYTDLFSEHPAVYDENKRVTTQEGREREVSWTAKDLLSWAERLSVKTEDHPEVLHNFAAVCPKCR